MRFTLLLAMLLAADPAIASTLGEVGNAIVRIGGGGLVEFDGATGALLGDFLSANPNDFAFDGSILYTTDPSDQIVAYDARSGAVLATIAGPGLIANAGPIAIAPDGSIVLRNQIGGTLSLDRFSKAGDLLGTITSTPVNDFVFGPNENIFATTPLDQVIEIRPSDGAILTVLTTAVRNPGPLLFLNDGSILVRDAGGVQRFYSAGAPLGTFTSALLNDLTLGPDGNVYGTDPSDAVLVFDGSSGASLGVFALTPANPGSIAFRPVPEPSTGLLVGMGIAVIADTCNRRTA